MAVQGLIGLRVALGAAVAMLLASSVPSIAEDAAPAGMARPSVEELAIPGEKGGAPNARESDAREAMSNRRRGQTTCRWSFLPA